MERRGCIAEPNKQFGQDAFIFLEAGYAELRSYIELAVTLIVVCQHRVLSWACQSKYLQGG